MVEYGETEFCLISNLRFGPYVDVINTKHKTKSALHSWLFLNLRNEDLQPKDIEDYIKRPIFETCSDDDAITLMNMLFLLRGLIGRDTNTYIMSVVFDLADNLYNWNR